MNKLKLLFILSVAVLISSCKDDDDNNEIGGTAELVGTWTYKSSTFDMTINGTDFIEFYSEAFEDLFDEEEIRDAFEIEVDIELTLTFEADGTYTATDSEESYSGTYSLSGDQLVLDAGTSDESATTVYTLTSSKLVIGAEEEYEEDMDYDGTDDTVVSSYTITLNKD